MLKHQAPSSKLQDPKPSSAAGSFGARSFPWSLELGAWWLLSTLLSVPRLFIVSLLALGAGYPTAAWAHDPGLSIATARIANGSLSIQLSIARCDVERLITL